LITIDVVGLFGNSLVCISVYKNRALRSKIGTVILALAVTDLLTSTIVVPFTVVSLIRSKDNIKIRPKWITDNESDVWCGIQGFFLYSMNAMSFISMATAAFIRFLCVVKPNVYRLYVKTKFIIVAFVIAAVVITIIQASLAIPGYVQYEFLWKFALCMMLLQGKYKPFRSLFDSIFMFLFFVLPMAVIVLCYTAIFFTVRKHNRRVHIIQRTSNSAESLGQKLKNKWNTVFSVGARRSTKQSSNERCVAQDESKMEKTARENTTETSDMSQKHISCDSQNKAENYKLLQGDNDLFPKLRKNNDINLLPQENVQMSDPKALTTDNQKDDTIKEDIPLTVFCASTSKMTYVQTKNENYSSTNAVSEKDESIDNHVSCANSKIQDSITSSSKKPVKSGAHSTSQTHNFVAHNCSKKPSDLHIKPASPNSVPNSSQPKYQPAQDKQVVVKGQVTEAKVTKTVLAVFIGYICCWIPTGLYFAISRHTDYEKSAPYAVLIPICGALSSAINTFIYGAADRRFRQTYKRVLKCEKI